MREVKRWNDEKYCRAYLIKSNEYMRDEFIQDYREYLQGWRELYYYENTQSYLHRHFENSI